MPCHAQARRVSAFLVAAVLVPAASFSRADAPAELTFPLDSKTAVTFGPAGCPVLVVGPDVRDAKTGAALRELAGGYEPRGHRALSADGKYFAAASKSPNQTDTAVSVWSTETGQKVLEVPGGGKRAFVDVLTFAGGKLILGGRHGNQLDVWDLKVVKQVTAPTRRIDADKIAVSPDGKFLACIDNDKVIVADATTGKSVAVMAPPGPGVTSPGGKPTPKMPAGRDAVFVYAWTRGLAFSPDGKELAAFSLQPSPRLLVWDAANGKLLLDEPVPIPRLVTPRYTLEWLPDKSGWLVNGALFDRASKRVVLSARVPFAAEVLPHLLDKDRLIGVFGEDKGRLRTVAIPREKINASLKQMADKAPSFITPGEAVSVELELAGLRGDEAETRKILTDALTARLARDGIPVAAGKPTVLRLRFSEEAGDTLPIYERQSPFDLRGKDTGRTATEAKGAAVVELVAKGEAQPLWRGHLRAMSARSFREEITDATVRKSMLEHLTGQLNATDIPYFIPKSKDTVALPCVVE